MEGDKVYRARVLLGIRTDTGDITGKAVERGPLPDLSWIKIKQVLKKFLGASDQTPPMYSAIKLNGRKLYKLARKGIEIPRAPRKIRIMELDLLDAAKDELEFRIRCSKGTYVRALIEDIGRALGVPATLKALVRERSGTYEIGDAISWNELLKMDRESLLSVSHLISSPSKGEDTGGGENRVSSHPHPNLPPSRGKGIEGLQIQ